MKGFHPTPAPLVDRMVRRLFDARRPRESDAVLDPGCGEGAFIEGILRWCKRNNSPTPRIVGVESDPRLAALSRTKFADKPRVVIEERDFLAPHQAQFDFVVGNPPYVSILELSVSEKQRYRDRFGSATNRFDLYFLFMEQALRLASPIARLVFVTPEKFAYVESAASLRAILASDWIKSIEFIEEDAFPGLVAYPTITTIDKGAGGEETAIELRDGTRRSVRLPEDGQSWMPAIQGAEAIGGGVLNEVCRRISAGVATGADGVFVVPHALVPENLKQFAHPSVAGREISWDVPDVQSKKSMLIPYDANGNLLSPGECEPLISFLRKWSNQLRGRSCVSPDGGAKPWFAFHETPDLGEILRPKILCKDIAPRPTFVADYSGRFVPRHSVYYIVPKRSERLPELLEYLRGPRVTEWLMATCQRASKGYVRVQSSTLKKLPLPPHFTSAQGQDGVWACARLTGKVGVS